MARRSDHSREELHNLILEKAQEIAELEGLRGLTARRVAREIGYTIGTLYNLFDDLDDMIVHMNGRTLDALYDALATVVLTGEPENDLRVLVDRYVEFVDRHPKLWSVLFDHHLPEPKQLPEWHREKILRLLGLLERPLAPFFDPGREAERLHAARVFWSSLHGICSLESAGKVAPDETVLALADTLISLFLAGLRRA
jgi:AcrR family transcriptional regulator